MKIKASVGHRHRFFQKKKKIQQILALEVQSKMTIIEFMSMSYMKLHNHKQGLLIKILYHQREILVNNPPSQFILLFN